MRVYGLDFASDRGLINLELQKYANRFAIEHFRGVYTPRNRECGIVNFNTSKELNI